MASLHRNLLTLIGWDIAAAFLRNFLADCLWGLDQLALLHILALLDSGTHIPPCSAPCTLSQCRPGRRDCMRCGTPSCEWCSIPASCHADTLPCTPPHTWTPLWSGTPSCAPGCTPAHALTHTPRSRLAHTPRGTALHRKEHGAQH